MTDKEALIGAGVMGGAIALGLRCLIRTEQKLTLWPAGAQPRLKARLQGCHGCGLCHPPSLNSAEIVRQAVFGTHGVAEVGPEH